MPSVFIGDEAGREEWDAAQRREAVEAQIRTDVADGLLGIRAAVVTLDEVIDSAVGIETFPGTSLTQAQIIATLKQLATAVRILAQGEQMALRDVDYLARLQLRLFDAVD